METVELKQKKRKVNFDRVTLKDDALVKIDSWLGHIRSKSPGIKISRAEIVHWLILAHAEALSEEELNGLNSMYFDDVAFAAWAYKQIKEAQKRNEKLSLSDVVLFAKGGITADSLNLKP